MKEYVSCNGPSDARKGNSVLLALFWMLGLLSGFYLFISRKDLITFDFEKLLKEPASFLSLLFIVEFPLLIAIFAARTVHLWMLLMLCFAKAFSMGFLSAGLYIFLGKGFWIAQYLVHFSSTFSSFLLYFYCIRVIKGSFSNLYLAMFYSLLSGTVTAFTEHFLIAPFWLTVAKAFT